MFHLAEGELVGVEVVRFLNACQSDGADIANGSRSIRDWMLRNGNQGCNHTIVDPPDKEDIAA